MKTIIAIAALALVIGFAGTVAAQTVYGPLSDAAAAQLYVDRQLTASATQCVTNVIQNCNNGLCPAATLGQCSGTVKAAKAACPNCAKKPWVLEKITGVLAKNAEDLAALRDELMGKLKELEDRIAALEGRVTNLEEWRVVVDAKLAEHERAIKALQDKDKEQDEAIADLEGSQLHLELSGFGDFAFSGNVSVLGAMAGIALGIADNVDATVGAGLGGSLDGEFAISIRAGIMLRPARGARGFTLGFLGFGTFEGLEDDGDRELGGLALLRYTFGPNPVDSGFFIEAFAGVAYESKMVPVAQPLGSPIRETTRQGAAAGNAGFALGYRF